MSQPAMLAMSHPTMIAIIYTIMIAMSHLSMLAMSITNMVAMSHPIKYVIQLFNFKVHITKQPSCDMGLMVYKCFA